MAIKIILLVVFFGVMLFVGVFCRRHVLNVSDFVLGGRGVGPWITAFSYGTSYFSAVIFVGYAGQFGWKYGISATWIGIGNALLGGMLAWIVLGRRTRVMTRHLQSSTMPEFFKKRFGSNSLRIAASMIIFIFTIPYTASLYNGLSRIFGMAFNIDYTVCVIGMAAFTCIYVVAGGYLAAAVNDFIQGIIMLVGIVAVVVSVLNGQGGFMSALGGLASVSDTAVSAQPGVFASFFGPDPLNLLGVIVLTSLGTWGLPQMIHKFYAIKNESAIRAGTVISTIFALVIAGGCYFLGGFGRLFDGAELYNANGGVIYDAIIPRMLASLPDILIGVVVILVLSASMSTLSSLVLTSSSTLTLDLICGAMFKKTPEKRKLPIMRVFIVFFIVVSAALALIQYKNGLAFIAQLMGISWGAMAGSFLAPFLYGLYWKKVSVPAVWACFITGVGITVSNMIWSWIGSPINAGAIAMLVGLAVVPLVSLVTKKPDRALVEEVFSCYKEKVAVSSSHSLEEAEEK